MFTRLLSLLIVLIIFIIQQNQCLNMNKIIHLNGDKYKINPVIFKDTPPGYDEIYGYPETIGGLIVEGPFPYKNGPVIYSKDNLWGAYGMIYAAPEPNPDHTCPDVPDDSPFMNSDVVYPVALTNGSPACGLGCNITQVQETGHDPCNVASLSAPYSNSKSSCFDLGPSFASGYGLCGYNCSLANPNIHGKPCSYDDFQAMNCYIYCDSRHFP
jgi:hypothetical protein